MHTTEVDTVHSQGNDPC